MKLNFFFINNLILKDAKLKDHILSFENKQTNIVKNRKLFMKQTRNKTSIYASYKCNNLLKIVLFLFVKQ